MSKITKFLTFCIAAVTLNLSAAQNIPWIDMNAFVDGTPEKKHETAMEFGKALEKFGFVAVTNIGIDQRIVDKAYTLAEDYFALPVDVKMKNFSGDGHRGYIPYGVEHAKNNPLSDLKEFYQMVAADHPQALWPDELPAYQEAVIDLYNQSEQCVKRCLQATAIYLGYEDQENILADLIGHGNSVMRIAYYPLLEDVDYPEGALRAAEHEDIDIMTVIPRMTEPGLQVLLNNGVWIDVEIPEGAAVINAGDTLSRLTNLIIPSTTHRVVNGSTCNERARLSVPFFGEPGMDTIVSVLDRCVEEGDIDIPEEITFGELLIKRLTEQSILGS